MKKKLLAGVILAVLLMLTMPVSQGFSNISVSVKEKNVDEENFSLKDSNIWYIDIYYTSRLEYVEGSCNLDMWWIFCISFKAKEVDNGKLVPLANTFTFEWGSLRGSCRYNIAVMKIEDISGHYVFCKYHY